MDKLSLSVLSFFLEKENLSKCIILIKIMSSKSTMKCDSLPLQSTTPLGIFGVSLYKTLILCCWMIKNAQLFFRIMLKTHLVRNEYGIFASWFTSKCVSTGSIGFGIVFGILAIRTKMSPQEAWMRTGGIGEFQ